MQKYTVSEIVQKFSLSESKVRRRIKKGKLPVIKEKEGKKDITKILVESEEMLMTLINDCENQIDGQISEKEMDVEFYDKKSKCLGLEKSVLFDKNQSTSSASLHAILKDLYNHNKLLVEDIKKYAELAGQAQLLTDSEHRTKQEYFQLMQEKVELQSKVHLLQQQLNEIQGQKKTPKKPLKQSLVDFIENTF